MNLRFGKTSKLLRTTLLAAGLMLLFLVAVGVFWPDITAHFVWYYYVIFPVIVGLGVGLVTQRR